MRDSWRSCDQQSTKAIVSTSPQKSWKENEAKKPSVLRWAIHSRRLHSIRMKWLCLFIAIISEVIGTSALKASQGFTRLIPSLLVIGGYATAFYFLALTLKAIPVGIAYAIWSGVGILLVSIAGFVLYRQSLDFPAIAGIGLIVIGVVVLCLFSKSAVH